jgi:hypothetical protein
VERYRQRNFKEIGDSISFCCGEISDSYLAVGTDSFVYRWGKEVVKVYKGPWLSMLPRQKAKEVVLSYSDATNEASRLAQLEKWKLDLFSSKRSIPFRIVPVKRVIECSVCQTPSAVSEFIEGRNLEETRKRDLPFDFKELMIAFGNFSLDIEEKIGYYGISILALNVKYLDGVLVVTDLCPDLSRFGKKNK